MLFKVIQVTKLKVKIPTNNQFSAPIIVKTSAITDNTLNVFLKVASSLFNCTCSMSSKKQNIQTNRHAYKRDRNGNCNSKAEKKMKKRQVLKFNADELCQTHYKKQHARTFKSKKGTSTKLQTKCNSFFCRKRQCETNTDCLADNYKTGWRLLLHKKTLWAKPSTCETCIAQSFAYVNTT